MVLIFAVGRMIGYFIMKMIQSMIDKEEIFWYTLFLLQKREQCCWNMEKTWTKLYSPSPPPISWKCNHPWVRLISLIGWISLHRLCENCVHANTINYRCILRWKFPPLQSNHYCLFDWSVYSPFISTTTQHMSSYFFALVMWWWLGGSTLNFWDMTQPPFIKLCETNLPSQ